MLYAGVHVGGTKILAGVFDAELNPLGVAKVRTGTRRDPVFILGSIARAVIDAANASEVSASEIAAVGIGLPAVVNPHTGTVTLGVNFGWKDLPVRELLQRTLPMPVFVDNDANLSLLGIYEHELRRAPKVLLGVFIGSGIGGAVITEGLPYRGASHSAGEVGHMILDMRGPKCACGRRGCFEALASRAAIFRDVRDAMAQGQETMLTEILGPDLAELRSGHLRKAFRAADPVVRTILTRAAEYTAIALSNLVLLWDPELIVLGGGLIEAVGTELQPLIQRLCGEMLPQGSASPPEIILTSLADNAGILGGAMHARNKLLPH
jgi:glucokinase